MKLVAKISGPVESDSDFYLAKGKYEGQDWEGVIQKKGDTGVLVPLKHKKAKNQVGNQKIVSYSGGVTAEVKSFRKGAEVTFENVGTLNRRPEQKDLKEDLNARLAEQDETIKTQSANQEKTNELMEAMMEEIKTLKEGKES
jgi:hypothetical protein